MEILKFSNDEVKEYVQLFYNKYCKDKKDIISLKDANVETLALIAAKLAYRSSVTRAYALCNYSGNNYIGDKEGSKIKCEKELISSYLISLYKNELIDFENESLDMWKKIKQVYRDNGFTNYKIGHAQKWLSMSIKYYYILLATYEIIEVNINNVFNGFFYFPVDGMVINHFKKKDWNIEFKDKCWTKCDNEEVFIEYLNSVKNHINMYNNPFIYELCVWWDLAAKKSA